MLAELIRVTRPGGRVGVLVRADVDMPAWVNLPLRADLKAKVEAPGQGAGKAARGCADAGLYRRFQMAGLVQVQMFPQPASTDAGPFLAVLETGTSVSLTPDELEAWWAAVAQAKAAGTFFIAMPHHCAVGTKP